MESFEAAKVVYNRILETESENITRKIIGYIYLLDHADREMIRLAFGPDNLIQNMIQKAKIELNLVSKPVASPPISPSLPFSPISLRVPQPQRFPSPATLQTPNWDPQLAYQNLVPNDCRYQNQDFIGLGDQFEPVNQEVNFPGDFSLRGRRERFPVKICHYFSKGHCKHGNNCKFSHAQSIHESYPCMFDFNSNELGADEQAAFSPGSLEKLEFEIMEILKSRRGNPISIASLPMIYYERYGRTLQAEGYLTESQRHGKAGYSLTKLLARLKNSIRLIDRPHGQHSVILAEDAPKYIENRYERNPGPIVNGSKQIYLTFPAESTFTEDDVANYFSTFGPVQDVRIPCQQKRMFGFVTFLKAETVQMILSKGNPHYVCGARVLVKPYREKSKFFDRKYLEKLEVPMCYHSHHMDMDPDLQAGWEASRFFGRQLTEEPEVAVQLEMMRLSQLQLGRRSSPNQSYFVNYLDDQKVSEDHEDHSKFPSPKHLTHLFDHTAANYTDQENDSSQDFHLPDSPFALPMGSSKTSNRQI